MRASNSWLFLGWTLVFFGLLGVAALLLLAPFQPLPDESFRQREFLEKIPYATGFDFPVGWPDAKGYYDARSFGVKGHMGSDWNGINGENTDLGDPIYATSEGMVIFSGYAGVGWGDCMIIAHRLPGHFRDHQIDSLYAHVQDRMVQVGDVVKRGQKIGTIGTAYGRYFAHLHFEIRRRPWMGIRRGYNDRREWWYNPTTFILEMREQAHLAQLQKGSYK
jgi:murein DD-endopeptidase MepM/ murein hydrolase activator NlpD